MKCGTCPAPFAAPCSEALEEEEPSCDTRGGRSSRNPAVGRALRRAGLSTQPNSASLIVICLLIAGSEDQDTASSETEA